jgi:hypothetical protein
MEWPIEIFAHDPETLAYFVDQDCKRGRPSLAHMVAESVVVRGSSAWSDAIQDWARRILAGRETAAPEDLKPERYAITDLLNDFRDDRPRAELLCIACALQPLVANFLLKAKGHWQTDAKGLPKQLQRVAPELSADLMDGFETFFQSGDRTPAVRAVEKALAAYGGELFAGYRVDAPSAWRTPTSEPPRLAGREDDR